MLLFVVAVSFAPDEGFLQAEYYEGGVMLSWTPPTTNEDGSSLTNLSHYIAYYGEGTNIPEEFENEEEVSGNLTAYAVENLPPGEWCFAMKSVNTEGLTSTEFSNVACKTIDSTVEEAAPPKAPGGLAAQ